VTDPDDPADDVLERVQRPAPIPDNDDDQDDDAGHPEAEYRDTGDARRFLP
jgi:hypothetical protein